MVKKIGILFICCFFFYGCGHKSTQKVEEASDFHLLVGVNKKVFQEGRKRYSRVHSNIGVKVRSILI